MTVILLFGAALIATALGVEWAKGLVGSYFCILVYAVIYDARYLATRKVLRRIGRDPELWMEP